MRYKDWAKKNANKKRPGMHGVYDALDMEDRVVGRIVYVHGTKVMTIAPIWPDEEDAADEKKQG